MVDIFNFWFQKHEGLKKMKMSKDEVKREAKDTDGNPEIKGERRRLHSEIQSGSLANNNIKIAIKLFTGSDNVNTFS